MALGYPICHFSVLASPMPQNFANIATIYGVSTKGYIKHIYNEPGMGTDQSEQVLAISNWYRFVSDRRIY